MQNAVGHRRQYALSHTGISILQCGGERKASWGHLMQVSAPSREESTLPPRSPAFNTSSSASPAGLLGHHNDSTTTKGWRARDGAFIAKFKPVLWISYGIQRHFHQYCTFLQVNAQKVRTEELGSQADHNSLRTLQRVTLTAGNR